VRQIAWEWVRAFSCMVKTLIFNYCDLWISCSFEEQLSHDFFAPRINFFLMTGYRVMISVRPSHWIKQNATRKRSWKSNLEIKLFFLTFSNRRGIRKKSYKYLHELKNNLRYYHVLLSKIWKVQQIKNTTKLIYDMRQ
jgi:hypothetical protein